MEARIQIVPSSTGLGPTKRRNRFLYFPGDCWLLESPFLSPQK
jgi:hypothetical protein